MSRPKQCWIDNEAEFAGQFKKLCKTEGLYSERVRLNLLLLNAYYCPLKFFFDYLEVYGYNYTAKISSICHKFCSKQKRFRVHYRKKVRNSKFLSIFYSQATAKTLESEFKIGGKFSCPKMVHLSESVAGHKSQKWNCIKKTTSRHKKG